MSPGIDDLHALLGQPAVDLVEGERSITAPGRRPVSPVVLDLHLAEHLGDDDLDVLVVDVHALRAVDGLHLADQVVLHGLGAADPQDVVRHQRAVDERVAGLDVVAGVDAEDARRRDQVLAASPIDLPVSVLGVISMIRLPRFLSPMRTLPAISAMTAGLRGRRASNSSVTRGRPPVMSCVCDTSRGVLARSVPAETFCPSVT